MDNRITAWDVFAVLLLLIAFFLMPEHYKWAGFLLVLAISSDQVGNRIGR